MVCLCVYMNVYIFILDTYVYLPIYTNLYTGMEKNTNRLN